VNYRYLILKGLEDYLLIIHPYI